MIRYALACEEDHAFESWFQSADAYDALRARDMVECPVCGSGDIRKKVMAPSIAKAASPSKSGPVAPLSEGAPKSGPLSSPASVAEQALRELRAKIEANSENVGADFVREARKIHHGEAPERSIIGEAKIEEAKALVEEGINVAPLPFPINRKTN